MPALLVHFRIALNVQLAISCSSASPESKAERRRDNGEAQIVSIQAPDGRDEWAGIVPRISRSLLRRCTNFLLPRNLDPREKRRRLGEGRITHLRPFYLLCNGRITEPTPTLAGVICFQGLCRETSHKEAVSSPKLRHRVSKPGKPSRRV